MPPDRKFTLGFIFDSASRHVLLVHKERPEWQKGKVNGVGGKYESGEGAEACIQRETQEETTLEIPESNWVYVGVIHQEKGDVDVLAARYRGSMEDAKRNDDEEIGWFPIDALPENVMTNVSWLVPLSLEKLDGVFKAFSVEY